MDMYIVLVLMILKTIGTSKVVGGGGLEGYTTNILILILVILLINTNTSYYSTIVL